MKICLIIDDYLPESIKIGAKMMHELAMEFIALEHTVTVVTPAPGLRSRYEILELDGVMICRFYSGEIKNISKVKRAVNETLLSYRAWHVYKEYFKQHPHDLIIYYSPTIFWAHLVNRLKKLWGSKSYLILRDFFPQWAIDNGMLSAKSPITYYFRWFESLNYRAADAIGIQSRKNLAWFSENNKIKKPLNLLYNWASNDPITVNSNYYREKLGLQNKVVFFYGGNIGHAQDMMNIVRLATALRFEHSAHFVLVGAGDEVELVRNSIRLNNLSNMTLLSPVEQSEFRKMLAEFDIGLFSLNREHTTHNFPGKILGYMVQEKPILGSINPENDLQDIIEEAKAGLVTINGDDVGLLSNAMKLLHNADLREKLGGNAKQLLLNVFSVQAAASMILAQKGRMDRNEMDPFNCGQSPEINFSPKKVNRSSSDSAR
jgi:glycosyltransferase involved in cell wall biosynthesis